MTPELIGTFLGGLASGMAGAFVILKILIRAALNEFWLKLQDPEHGFLTRELADARYADTDRRLRHLEGARGR